MSHRLWRVLLAPALLLAACSDSTDVADSGDTRVTPLKIGAIPDQDPQKLQRLYSTVAGELSTRLGMPVEYVPVTDYNAAVALFRAGDLDLVWFGGLTGVQARLQTPGSVLIAQRDIDEQFHSVFIANTSAGIEPFDNLAGLAALKGKRFTFGSESSTSGRLMPQHFLKEAGVFTSHFAGTHGFSGSHDKTIDLVQSGTFEAGVLNEQVWNSRLAAGTVDTAKVKVVFRTPPYHDYHWLLGPGAVKRYGKDFADKVRDALMSLSPEAVGLFGAKRFVPTEASNYEPIELIARDLGLVQ